MTHAGLAGAIAEIARREWVGRGSATGAVPVAEVARPDRDPRDLETSNLNSAAKEAPTHQGVPCVRHELERLDFIGVEEQRRGFTIAWLGGLVPAGCWGSECAALANAVSFNGKHLVVLQKGDIGTD